MNFVETSEVGKIYSNINKLDVRVTRLEEARPYLEDTIKQNTLSNDRLVDTLQEVRIAMEGFNGKIEKLSEDMSETRKEFENASKATNEHIAKVDAKLSSLEDKGKFDIWEYLKKNWLLIGALIGFGALYCAKYFQF